MTALDLIVDRDPGDEIAASQPVAAALSLLGSAIVARKGRIREGGARGPGTEAQALLVVAGGGNRRARHMLAAAGISLPSGPEALVVAVIPTEPRFTVLAAGSDQRGLAYAVLEIVDLVETSSDSSRALRIDEPIVGKPANKVRSVTRLFCSELEDKPWWYDEGFWDEYFTMLIGQRFNRFSMTLGLGYNYPWNVTDGYFYFAYPFLVQVPGYDVRVPQLPDDERDRNLSMLRHISERAHAVGLDFQLGLWTHAYRWFDSPDAQHTIEGLNADNHGPYCGDAIATLLDSCPEIDGVTLRIHGESGVPERSWDFWRHVFRGVADCGRTVGIDLHAKGLDTRTLDQALETGLPLTVSPKFWAEHMGLPYHQAAIRESERPPRADPSDVSEWHRHMSVSEGSRPFTRYGYGDFLREDRPYDVVFRLWAGTQRLLLWGDPAFAAGFGRAAGVSRCDGLEWMEPLTFKGREGTGIESSRTGYADETLVTRYDWQKYEYTYRLLGRLSYDPDAPPDSWRRMLATRLGPAAPDAEAALASASRILPLVTVAHHQSASNNYYWPEVYTHMPIVEPDDPALEHFLIDTPAPKRFGTVSPLDPEVFMSVADYAEDLEASVHSGRITPLQTAAWLDDHAATAAAHLDALKRVDPHPELSRWTVDTAIQAGLGRFYAAKLRAATYYEIHLRTGASAPLSRAVEEYREALAEWIGTAALAEGIYAADLTFGPQQWIRGHWSDRTAAIASDVEAMVELLDPNAETVAATSAAWVRPEIDPGPRPSVTHAPLSGFAPGLDLEITIELQDGAGTVTAASVRYRPMNQALTYSELEMDRSGSRLSATIPGDEIDGAYPLAYSFVVRDDRGRTWRYPGLGPSLDREPYYIVRPGL